MDRAARMLRLLAGATYTWVATDTTGYSPGYEVRGPDGRVWDVKLGAEAQSEVVASRVLWAIGYHQPPTYYVANWQLAGGPGGQQSSAHGFASNREDAEVIGDWSWADNEFIGTQPYHGLDHRQHSAEQLGLEDVEQQDLSLQERCVSAAALRRARSRRVARQDNDLPPALDPSHSRSRIRPGVTQQHRRFRIAGIHQAHRRERVDFDFDSIYGSIVDLVRPADVRWTAELLNRLTDAQWDDAFRAADYSPDVRARFIRKIKAKIAEGLAVS